MSNSHNKGGKPTFLRQNTHNSLFEERGKSALCDEVIIRKLFRSSFVETQLGALHESLGVNHLYITGAQTNNCVRHTCHGALELGYDITLISDAHTTSSYEWKGRNVIAKDVINEQNDNLSGYRLPDRRAKVVESAAITF